MDWLTFISNVIASTAWPISAVVIALLFRAQLTDLLKRITKGKFAGGEFEFSDSAQDQLADATEGSSSPLESNDSSKDENALDSAYRLLEISPRAAVVEAWRVMNDKALMTIMDHIENASEPGEFPYSGELIGRHLPTARMTEYFRKHRILAPDQIALFDELRRLRNHAAHHDDFEIGDKKGKEYLILTELLMESL